MEKKVIADTLRLNKQSYEALDVQNMTFHWKNDIDLFIMRSLARQMTRISLLHDKQSSIYCKLLAWWKSKLYCCVLHYANNLISGHKSGKKLQNHFLFLKHRRNKQ